MPAAIWHDFVGAAEPLVHGIGGSSAVTISFNTAAEAGDHNEAYERSDYGRYPFGGHRPFRLFWFRF